MVDADGLHWMSLEGGMAERVGFEPTLEFPLNTLSKRAPSTTRPPLLGMVVYLNLTQCLGADAGLGFAQASV